VALIASSTVGLVDRPLEQIVPRFVLKFAFKHTHGIQTIFRHLSSLYVAEFSLVPFRRMHNVCKDHFAITSSSIFDVVRAFPNGN